MFAHFPTLSRCCRVCNASIGCTTLKPDWLAGGRFVGKEQHDGLSCDTFEKQGAVAQDYWSQTASGRPCQYRESYNFTGALIWHYLNFSLGNYTVGPPEPSLLSLPPICTDDCATMFPTQCGD